MKKQKGITLIALVITIIVLLILAGASIAMLTGENGILMQAQTAKEETEFAEQEELERLLENEYQIAKNTGKATGTYEDYVLETKYNVEIGDYVNYNPAVDADGNAISASYTSYAIQNMSSDKNEGRTSGSTSDKTYSVSDVTTGWRVLGLENGKVKLISADPIATDYSLGGEYGYMNSVEELNAICSIFGNGKGASSAKSLDVNDVNTLANYTSSTNHQIFKYRLGSMYLYNGQNTLEYTTNGGTYWDTSRTITSFRYYDNDTKQFVNLANGVTTGDITSYYSSYNVASKLNANTNISQSKRSVLVDMLSKGTSASVVEQFLATRTQNVGPAIIGYGIQVMNEYVNPSSLIVTPNTPTVLTKKIRPVVYLNADVEIQKDATTDGSTQAKACIIK